jgi:mRNA-degrading endonuclease RelE of RelBE toxin-antitoxin system
MGGYEVFLHLSVLDSVPKSGTQRRRIMNFVRSLRERPDTPGDFSDKDPSLRVRQVKIVGDYAVTYWVDAPVKAVMVVDVRLADK